MEKNISLAEIISMAVNGDDWTKRVKVRPYIPIIEKGTICRRYMLDFDLMNDSSLDSVSIAIEQELLWKFDVLLEYTNISVEKKDKTFDNYDICSSYGIFDNIHSLCEVDYVKMRQMIDKSLNLSDVSNVINLISGTQMEETIRGLRDAVKEIKDSNALDRINKLLAFNNPALAQFVELQKAKEMKESIATK